MPLPTLVGVTYDIVGSTVTPPAHQVGDLILVWCFRGIASSPVVPPGLGWTAFPISANDTTRVILAYKYASSTSEAIGTGWSTGIIHCAVWRNAALGARTTIGAATSQINYNGLTLRHPQGNSRLMAFVGQRIAPNTGDIDTPPTGMSLEGTAVRDNAQTAWFTTAGPTTSWTLQSVESGEAIGWRTDVFEITYADSHSVVAGSGTIEVVGSTPTAEARLDIFVPGITLETQVHGPAVNELPNEIEVPVTVVFLGVYPPVIDAPGLGDVETSYIGIEVYPPRLPVGMDAEIPTAIVTMTAYPPLMPPVLIVPVTDVMFEAVVPDVQTTLPPGTVVMEFPSTVEMTAYAPDIVVGDGVSPPTKQITITPQPPEYIGQRQAIRAVNVLRYRMGLGAGPSFVRVEGTPPVADGEVGQEYPNFQVQGRYGVAPYVYSKVGPWPPGMYVNPATGIVAGVPQEPGFFGGLSVKATDKNGNEGFLPDFSIDVGYPASVFIAPDGTGLGTTAAKAAPLSMLNTLLGFIPDGGTVYIIANRGSYVIPGASTTISNGGSASTTTGRKYIEGIHENGTPMRATFVGTRQAWTAPATAEGWVNAVNYGGNTLFRLINGCDHLVFKNLSFHRFNQIWNLSGTVADDLQVLHCDFYNCRDGWYTDINSQITNVLFQWFDGIGFSKRAIRMRGTCAFWKIYDCNFDSRWQDKDSFASGIQLEHTAHDCHILRGSTGNCRDTTNTKFYNADGVQSERGNYNLLIEDHYSYGCTDGGYDLKSEYTTLRRCIAYNNKRGYRLWGGEVGKPPVLLEDCISDSPQDFGEVGGGSMHVWGSGNKNGETPDAHWHIVLTNFKCYGGTENKTAFFIDGQNRVMEFYELDYTPVGAEPKQNNPLNSRFIYNTTAAIVPSGFDNVLWGLTPDEGGFTVGVVDLPSDNGSTITAIEYQVNGGAWVSSGDVKTFSVTGYGNGNSISVAIRPVNYVGAGEASTSKNVSPRVYVPPAWGTPHIVVTEQTSSDNARISGYGLKPGDFVVITFFTPGGNFPLGAADDAGYIRHSSTGTLSKNTYIFYKTLDEQDLTGRMEYMRNPTLVLMHIRAYRGVSINNPLDMLPIFQTYTTNSTFTLPTATSTTDDVVLVPLLCFASAPTYLLADTTTAQLQHVQQTPMDSLAMGTVSADILLGAAGNYSPGVVGTVVPTTMRAAYMLLRKQPPAMGEPDEFLEDQWLLLSGGARITVIIESLPADNGNAITQVQYQIGEGVWNNTGGTGSFTITGLSDNQIYKIRIRAVNIIGPGPVGDQKQAQPAQDIWTPEDLASKLLAHWNVDSTTLLTLVSARIMNWKDQVAFTDLVQSTSVSRPEYFSGGFLSGPVASFAGLTQQMAREPSGLPSGASASELWLIVDQKQLVSTDTNKRGAFTWGDTDANSRLVSRVVVGGVNRVQVSAGNGTTETTLTDSTVDFSGIHVIRAVWTGSTMLLSIDRSPLISTSIIPNTASTRIRLGAIPSGVINNTWFGGIKEVAVTQLLSAGEVANMWDYMTTRAGLS